MPFSASMVAQSGVLQAARAYGFTHRRQRLPFKSPTLKSYQLDDLPLRVLIGIDVALGNAQARVPRQHLHISERASNE